MSFSGGVPTIMEQKVERWFLVALALISAWIVTCLFLVQGEYGDGYQTIVNSRYLFADSPSYFVQRGPLAAVSLFPIELATQALALDPLDVRPYHAMSGFLHIAYLYACWVLLRHAPGSSGARLIAFSTAILSAVFYAYAPYLSHDLFPGLLFLIMIFLAHRWLDNEQPAVGIALILLGAAVTLIKQTYAIFWVAIIVFALANCLARADDGRISWRGWLKLTGLATCSAIISWLGYAWFASGILADEPFLMRPVRVILAVSEQYSEEPLAEIFPLGIYLRNLHNYGIAAVLMVVPGLVMAFRGSDSRMKMVAVCWLISVLVMLLTSFREVRYLAFVAPLTAMLIAPVAQALLVRRNLAFAALIALVLYDQSRGLTIAAEQITTSPRTNVTRFINAPQSTGNVYASKALSIVFDASSPIRRDRYYGIYHLTPTILFNLYQGQLSIAAVPDFLRLGSAGMQPGDRVYLANDVMIRRPPWHPGNLPNSLEDFLLIAGNIATVRLRATNDNFEIVDNDGRYLMFLPAADVGPRLPVISAGTLTAGAAHNLYGDLAEGSSLEVSVVILEAICQADACSYASTD